MQNTNATDFHNVVSRLRNFFLSKWWIEVHPQSRLSILAACEDPTTIATFDYQWQKWPLPQTGQMRLEHELLCNPWLPGVFCVSTSYRNEQNPIPGRHETIFPMFEFETKWALNELQLLECELLEHLWFGSKDTIPAKSYSEVAEFYGTKELTSEHELKMDSDFGHALLLSHFPQYTSPFWNMKKEGETSNKIDVILHGMETIWSAERSTNPAEMRELFHTISEWWYAQILYDTFGKARVESELESFLSYDFFPRFGGGIGVTRLIRAMRLQGLL
jgi:aspartyl/asparaginyl-tRNA synthetase